MRGLPRPSPREATMELNAVYNTIKDMHKRIEALRGYL
jgi:hypothetical protein